MLEAAFSDLRVLELGDENGEFAGKLLAANGAEVIRIEPPGGGPGRRLGPFYGGGLAEPGAGGADSALEASLYHWHYNLGKKGLTLDIDQPAGRELFLALLQTADILIESHPPGYLAARGLDYAALAPRHPRLIMLSISPFGQDGPWRDYQANDLVHLALGGETMVCGYDRSTEGEYDTSPIAAQMWHSRHCVGNLGFMNVMAAVLYRDRTGEGQHIDLSVHEAISNATEDSIPRYLTGGPVPQRRISIPLIPAKDGKFVVVHSPTFPGEWDKHVAFLAAYGAAADLLDPMYADEAVRRTPEAREHLAEVTARFIASVNAEDIWVEAQQHDVIWVSVRAPEDNLDDVHFRGRGAVGEIVHPELGRAFSYPTAPRAQTDLPWRAGPRAPFLGEHTAELLAQIGVSPERLAALRREGVV